jgi:glucosamine kinase
MDEPLFMGFDAGATKTVCLVGDRHSTIGRGESGPANPSSAGVAGFSAAIAAAAREALAGYSGSRPRSGPRARAWIGVAGAETPAMRAALRAAAIDALEARQVWISHDARLLLTAAGVGSGIAVVAGTGSSVYGLSADGREVTVGGWGHLLGDEGSGYDIARQALRAVTQAADGRGPQTRLSDEIPAALGVASVQALRGRLYPAAAVADVAQLARVVVDVSADDEIASAIVSRAATELALAVRTCRQRLPAADEAPLPVVIGGGLMNAGSPLLERLAKELEQEIDRYRVMPLTQEPAAGALALARAGPDEAEEAEAEEEEEEEEVLESPQQVQPQPKESLS